MKYYVETYKACRACDSEGYQWVEQGDWADRVVCEECRGTKEVPAREPLDRAIKDLLRSEPGFAELVRGELG